MPRADMYAIPGKDTGFHYPAPSTCELYGEHQGDNRIKDDSHGRWEVWSCCDAREFLGELADCDTCLNPGLLAGGADLPAGWVEDTNGAHCPKCQ